MIHRTFERREVLERALSKTDEDRGALLHVGRADGSIRVQGCARRGDYDNRLSISLKPRDFTFAPGSPLVVEDVDIDVGDGKLVRFSETLGTGTFKGVPLIQNKYRIPKSFFESLPSGFQAIKNFQLEGDNITATEQNPNKLPDGLIMPDDVAGSIVFGMQGVRNDINFADGTFTHGRASRFAQALPPQFECYSVGGVLLATIQGYLKLDHLDSKRYIRKMLNTDLIPRETAYIDTAITIGYTTKGTIASFGPPQSKIVGNATPGGFPITEDINVTKISTYCAVEAGDGLFAFGCYTRIGSYFYYIPLSAAPYGVLPVGTTDIATLLQTDQVPIAGSFPLLASTGNLYTVADCDTVGSFGIAADLLGSYPYGIHTFYDNGAQQMGNDFTPPDAAFSSTNVQYSTWVTGTAAGGAITVNARGRLGGSNGYGSRGREGGF